MTVNFCAAFEDAQKFGEVLFNRCEIHFIKAYEERSLGVEQGFCEEFYKRSELIMSTPNLTFISEQFCRVVPVRLDFDKAVIAGRS